MQYDVIVIGAGVTGAMAAYQLSRYQLKVCVLDKRLEPAAETSSANSGIVHAGYDAKPGSQKAALNVRGNLLMEEICKDLDVPFRRIGSLVVAFSDAEAATVRELYESGNQNGVPELRIIDAKETYEREPNLQPGAVCALYAPTAGIVCPYELTTAALEVACVNGVDYVRSTQVTRIETTPEGFIVTAGDKQWNAKVVVNAAGLFADQIAHMAGDDRFTITPRKGEYILFEKSMGSKVNHVVFQTPANGSKGVLVAPTVDGNLYIGPNANVVEDKNDTSTTWTGLEEIKTCAAKSVGGLDMRLAITNFAGLRATPSTGDFIVDSPIAGFVNAAGIESPGLSAAPAIAEKVVELVRNSGRVQLQSRPDWVAQREPVVRFREMTNSERAQLVAKNPAYGRIICRCETVTEQEIRDAIRRPAGARSVDGVKRRTRSGMGKCQGGFCGPRVVDILAQELQCEPTEITKFGGASYMLTGKTR